MTNASSLNLSELLLLPSIQLFKNYQGGNSTGLKIHMDGTFHTK